MTAAVSRDDWTRARIGLLAHEKAHMRAHDELAAARRALPRVLIDASYRFTSERGGETLGELFDGRAQLAVYHFMFAPDWEEGCKSCSFWADNMNGIDVHLAHRDTTLVLVSSAPFEKLDAYRGRMGWTLRWVSSNGIDFGRDFGVSFPEAERVESEYNYGSMTPPPQIEMPGLSFFAKEGEAVYHTYSTYGRGIEEINGAYRLLDMTALGRDEPPGRGMGWLRRRDQY
ncbi:DUF899 domain-containing protein [Pseudoruegeria sp. HB172150]|uniref:DUF899 domain-containing protein n=1 Tax=Pseudoruegeria sp. HB172150 TaxID=2721164 RepID=UPI001556AE2F|nr:DUF899 domain-containing protein [Pseudoruegeria sp. HB172150]